MMIEPLPIVQSEVGPSAAGGTVQRRSRRSIDNRQSAIDNLAARLFGVTDFRPLQREAIEASLNGDDSLVIMPTGSGKSLCYQLPAVAESGLTLVVSPLIALMDDQIMALKERGVAAESIHGDKHWRSNEDTFRAAKEDRLRLLYVSPERCDDLAFLAILRQCDVRSLVIDEAHCISIWGPDFRPAYAKLGQLRVMFPDVPIAAFTATATSRVREQIKESLILRKPAELIGDFDRPNLSLRALPRGRDADTPLLETVRRLHSTIDNRQSTILCDGIIYCPTRADTERIAAMLRSTAAPGCDSPGCDSPGCDALGYDARPYHAGLSPKERRSVHEWFVGEALGTRQKAKGTEDQSTLMPQCLSASMPASRIVVATIAFGMGIDKPDVRFVIHHGMPSSLDVYHQEIGRAGRDGQPAKCVLLYSPDDYQRWVGMFQSQGEGRGDAAYHGKMDALSDMEAFCGFKYRDGGLPLCRHAHLVEYFGQDYVAPPPTGRVAPPPPAVGCGACDVCLSEPTSEPPRLCGGHSARRERRGSDAPARGPAKGTSNGE